MADKKISALPAATTPLAGTEVLPIVQGGVTDKVSVANLTAGRAVSGSSFTTTAGNFVSAEQFGLSWGVGSTYIYGSSANAFIRLDVNNATAFGVDNARNATVNVGNLIIGTAGKGIDFSANAHAAGMTSELLNDYEEGTFTPTAAGSSTGGTATYSVQEGVYTKIGRLVTFRVNIAWTSGTGAGFMDVRGLPFTSNAYNAAAVAYFDQIGLTANHYLNGGLVFQSGTNVRLYQSPLAGGYAAPVAYSAQGGLIMSGQYFV